MIEHALKTSYLAVRRLDRLPSNSKEYRKTFATLRNHTQYAMIEDFRSAEPGDEAYPFKTRKKRALIAAVALILLSVVMLVLTLIYGSDSEIQAFTPEETRAFVLWMCAIFVPLALALLMALVIRRNYDAYLRHAMDSLRVDAQDISDAELEQILNYSDHDIEVLYDDVAYDDIRFEQCGCYSCMARFDMRELRYDRGVAVCPECRQDTILFGFKDMPITEDILQKAKRFWN